MTTENIIPVRVTFMIVTFLVCMNLYMMRTNLNVAIVAIVDGPSNVTAKPPKNNGCNHTAPMQLLSDITKMLWMQSNVNQTDLMDTSGKNWDENQQALVLASFFYGYILLQLPGGYLADKYGGKNLLTAAMFATSLLTLLSPIAANIHYLLLSALRFIMGLFTGFAFPAVQSMIAVWIPKDEVSTVFALIGCGVFTGIIFSTAVTGILSDATLLGGWPASFYLFGIIGFACTVMLALCVFDTPEKHPRITPSEQAYILENRSLVKPDKEKSLPWKSIITSVPVWAAFGTQWAHQFVGYLLLTDLPKYFDNVLGISLSENGVLMAAPNVANAILSVVFGYVTDTCIRRMWCTTTNARKFIDFVSAVIPALCLFLITLQPCHRVFIIVFMTIANIATSPSASGVHLCYMGMAPEFVGTLYGLANMFGNTPGFLVPQIVGWLTENNDNVNGWSDVFHVTAAVSVVFTVLFVFFGSADLQPWSCAYDEDQDRLVNTDRKSSINSNVN